MQEVKSIDGDKSSNEAIRIEGRATREGRRESCEEGLHWLEEESSAAPSRKEVHLATVQN